MLASSGTHISSAQQDYINMDDLLVGLCIEADYTAPETESATLNLKAANGDTLLHVDYRVDWGPNKDTVVLNTQTGGEWGTEQLVTGIKSTPGSMLKWVICAQEDSFSIQLNEKEVATYAYRINAPVRRLDFTQYENANSFLRQLCVLYSE